MNSSISSRGNWEGTKSKPQRLTTILAEQQVHNTKKLQRLCLDGGVKFLEAQ
jgi:hypothetical protein